MPPVDGSVDDGSSWGGLSRSRQAAFTAGAAIGPAIVGTVKYIHHRPNVSPVPATATSTASTLGLDHRTKEVTVPITPSPGVMIVSRA